MHLLVYTGQVSGRLNDKIFSRVGVLYNLKDMASSRNLVSTIGVQASPKRGTEPGVRKCKRPLLASHTRCKCSMETTHNSMKVKLGI